MTPDEFRRSLDAFPLEYQAILDRHTVIAGTPPFAGVDGRRRGSAARLRGPGARASHSPAPGLARRRPDINRTWSTCSSDRPRRFARCSRNVARLQGAPHATDAELAAFARRSSAAARRRRSRSSPSTSTRSTAGRRSARLADIWRRPEQLWNFVDAGARVTSIRPTAAVSLAVIALTLGGARTAAQSLPALTAPVNDFAQVLNPRLGGRSTGAFARCRRPPATSSSSLPSRPSRPFGSIEEYAVRLFEKAGIGKKDKHNGLLIVLALNERRVRIEVGYGLEEFITDGFSGETIREVMLPAFRQGDYGRACSPARRASFSGSPRPAASRSRTCPGPAEAGSRRAGFPSGSFWFWRYSSFRCCCGRCSHAARSGVAAAGRRAVERLVGWAAVALAAAGSAAAAEAAADLAASAAAERRRRRVGRLVAEACEAARLPCRPWACRLASHRSRTGLSPAGLQASLLR